MAKRKGKKTTEEPRPITVSIVRCMLCNAVLPAGESPDDHLTKRHADLFKVETYIADRKIKLGS